MREQWKEELKDKLADYEVEQMPEGLWENIETSIPTAQHNNMWMRKIAAVFAGLIIMGAVYAMGVAMGLLPNIFTTAKPEQTKPAQVMTSKVANAPAQKLDTRPVVFDETPLKDILADFATYYGVKVTYKNNDAKNVRLFFKWNKKAPLQQNVDALNAFERIDIQLSNDEITVE